MQGNTRRVVAKWFTIFLFGLLISSFALWGVGDIFRDGGQHGPVIQAGETEIGPNEFARSYRRQFNQLRQRLGGQLTPDMAEQLGVDERIIRQIATRAVFQEATRDMGLVISEDQLVAQITEQDAFRNSQGQFQRARFETALRRSGLSEAQYLGLLETDIQRDLLVTAATAGVRAPGVLTTDLYQYRAERRQGAHVVFRDAAFEVESPTNADLRAYYEDHDQPFMAPPYREITLIHLTPDQLVEEVKVSEEALREAYESRRDAYETPERRELRQIVLDDRETARTARARLQDGATLEDVAKDLSAGGVADLGTNARDDLFAPELAEAAFSTPEGKVSAPVETALGWHLVKVDDILPAESRAFESVKDELRPDLAREQSVDTLVSLANELDDRLAGGTRLEQAADALGLNVRHIPAIDRDGNAPSGEPVANLPQDQDFLATIFDTQEGEQSLLRETGAGGYYVLRVDSVTPTQKRPFAEVEEQVRDAYRADRRRQAAHDAAEALIEAVESGTDFADAAAERNLSVATTPPLGRQDNSEAGTVAQALAGPLFEADREGALVRTDLNDGVAVARLTRIETPSPNAEPEAVANLRQQVTQQLRSEMLLQFVDSLRADYPVRVNQAQVDRIVNQIR